MSPATSSVALDQEIARFLFVEAALLDDRRWDDWLGLWTDDATYSVPIRSEVLDDDAWGRPLEASYGGPGELHFVEDPKLLLDVRVAKLKTGKAWAEQPPSYTTRLITNVHVVEESGDEVLAHSNFLVHRARGSSHSEQFVGTRRDRLRSVASGWQISARRVYLNAHVLQASNLELFF